MLTPSVFSWQSKRLYKCVLGSDVNNGVHRKKPPYPLFALYHKISTVGDIQNQHNDGSIFVHYSFLNIYTDGSIIYSAVKEKQTKRVRFLASGGQQKSIPIENEKRTLTKK